MKKLVVAVCVCVGLWGCGGGTKNNDPDSKANQSGKQENKTADQAGKYQSATVSFGDDLGNSVYRLVCDTTSGQCTLSDLTGQNPLKYGPIPGATVGPAGTYSMSTTKSGNEIIVTVSETSSGRSWWTADFGQQWHAVNSPTK